MLATCIFIIPNAKTKTIWLRNFEIKNIWTDKTRSTEQCKTFGGICAPPVLKVFVLDFTALFISRCRYFGNNPDPFSIWPVGWGCRIHRRLLCRGVRLPNECPVCDSKQPDGRVPVILEIWRMLSTPSLPSLLRRLWPGVVAPDRFLSMGQKELKCVRMLNWITWNRTVLINWTLMLN